MERSQLILIHRKEQRPRDQRNHEETQERVEISRLILVILQRSENIFSRRLKKKIEGDPNNTDTRLVSMEQIQE